MSTLFQNLKRIGFAVHTLNVREHISSDNYTQTGTPKVRLDEKLCDFRRAIKSNHTKPYVIRSAY
ncbi:hypothetical protein [Pseudomonas qingdaonensis]|uniref:hypothetical protein n=1 Tax=Pseudomonas qingdaonensis TaxID=2056231 RepID=UPI000E373575